MNDSLKELTHVVTEVLVGRLPSDAKIPWHRQIGPATYTTHAITVADVLRAIDEYVERRDAEKVEPTVDISEGVIRTGTGRWTLAEWARRIERKLDEAIARWEAK